MDLDGGREQLGLGQQICGLGDHPPDGAGRDVALSAGQA
jgi:hypothetical protein